MPGRPTPTPAQSELLRLLARNEPWPKARASWRRAHKIYGPLSAVFFQDRALAHAVYDAQWVRSIQTVRAAKALWSDLADWGVDLEQARPGTGDLLLHRAVGLSDGPHAKALLDLGVDPARLNRAGRTALEALPDTDWSPTAWKLRSDLVARDRTLAGTDGRGRPLLVAWVEEALAPEDQMSRPFALERGPIQRLLRQMVDPVHPAWFIAGPDGQTPSDRLAAMVPSSDRYWHDVSARLQAERLHQGTPASEAPRPSVRPRL